MTKLKHVRLKKHVLFSVVLVLFGCKANENYSGSESVSVLKLKRSYANEVSFVLVNTSEETVEVESTENLYIQRKEEERWERVNYTPCLCGTPCRPPALLRLNPGEQRSIQWNLISRMCEMVAPGKPSVATLEERVSEGNYRMIFKINRQKEGKRIAPERLVVTFGVKE